MGIDAIRPAVAAGRTSQTERDSSRIPMRGSNLTMPRIDFPLTGEFIALNDLLKVTGICPSGGAGKALVASGAVAVDGVVEVRKTCKIRPGQTVSMGATTIRVLRAAPRE